MHDSPYSSSDELPDAKLLARRYAAQSKTPAFARTPVRPPCLFDDETPPRDKTRATRIVTTSKRGAAKPKTGEASVARKVVQTERVVQNREAASSNLKTPSRRGKSNPRSNQAEDAAAQLLREAEEYEPSGTRNTVPRRRLVRRGELEKGKKFSGDSSDSDFETMRKPRTIDLVSSPEASPRPRGITNYAAASDSEDEGFISAASEDSDLFRPAIISYSPPRSTKPKRILPASQTPTTNLSTPLAKKSHVPKIPPTPHRPDSDEFWDEEVNLNWIDLHTPKPKAAAKSAFNTPSKGVFSVIRNSNQQAEFDKMAAWEDEPEVLDLTGTDDGEDVQPEPVTAKKPLSKAAALEAKEKRKAKKEFDATKVGIAEGLLKQLDEKIGGGEVGRKAASGGGIKIIWSKTLRSTAGVAKWKRRKQYREDGTWEDLHFCSIELAEKVVDDLDRLYNTLAHEFCHLCSFVISDISKPPHGDDFKKWARQASMHFKHLGIKVTTTHSYQLDSKFEWTCQNTGCGYVYKRHSSSINPEKQMCGSCKVGLLVQTKPKLKEKKPPTAYQQFMKENYARIKSGAPPGAPKGEIMKLVGAEYRRCKETLGTTTPSAMSTTVLPVGLVGPKKKSPPDAVSRLMDAGPGKTPSVDALEDLLGKLTVRAGSNE